MPIHYKMCGSTSTILSNLKQNVMKILDLLKYYKEKDGICKFLTWLNKEFNPDRVQVPGKDLSSLNETMIVFGQKKPIKKPIWPN